MPIIKPLTSLRFLAAMMVLAEHYWGFAAGYSGVTFFFVLSGFDLALNYAGKVSSLAERRLFWWKRFARIYPTHLLTLLIAIPISGSMLAAVDCDLPVGRASLGLRKTCAAPAGGVVPA